MRFFLTALLRPAAASSLAFAASRRQASTREPLIHSSFKEIVDCYDAFILDQFGVLHNGVEALAGAIETVEYLNKKNKKLIILSNTSAPSVNALAKLPKLGFQLDHFVGAVTSGEEASRFVRHTYGSHADTTRATKALFLTWNTLIPNNPRLTAPPQAFLDQCGNIQVTAFINDSDLLLLHGSEVWYRGEDTVQESLGSFIETGGLEIVDPFLEQCLQRNLPMVCANPDEIVVTPSGGTAHMPGRIAQRYQELGGNCRIFGKPDSEHFEACLSQLQVEKDRVAHVGDSLHHDIAGAVAAGIPSVFVTSGIHASQLGTTFGVLPETDTLAWLFDAEGSIYPTHVVSAFRL